MNMTESGGTGPRGRYLAWAALIAVLVVSVAVLSRVYLSPAKIEGAPPDDITARVRDLISRGDYRGEISLSGGNIIAVGNGKISAGTAQGKLLARRAALTDARRNLLTLKQAALRGPGYDGPGNSVSGRIGAHRVTSERVSDGIYKIEVEMPLYDLLYFDLSEWN
jgi:hypothetical protein